jgi:hypothetical protein
VVAIVALAIAAIAVAYVLNHPTIDFRGAPRGPHGVVEQFEELDRSAPAGMAPHVKGKDARRVAAVTIDGKEHILWVAPTSRGGYCFAWSHLMGGCRASAQGASARRTAVTSRGNSRRLTVIAGAFFEKRATRVIVEYANGVKTDIAFFWVTAPIDAGFFIYRVPNAHRTVATRPTVITLLDSRGGVIRRDPVPGP